MVAAAPEKTAVCTWCGTTFELDPRPQVVRRDTCSPRCRMAVWREKRREKRRDEFTGECAVCGKEVEYPHKTCSRECRAESQRTGLTMGTYVCAFCGKVVTRPANDARRNKHCSKVCAKLSESPMVTLPDIAPSFGHWIAGLTDGEGCFFLSIDKRHTRLRFMISLRMDDRPLLEMVQKTLGFGAVYDSRRIHSTIPNGKPKSTFTCSTARECAAIVELFRRFPLQSKKARDFAIWAEANKLHSTGGDGRAKLAELATAIRTTRIYVDPDV